ncbi:phosphatidylinositol phosphate synthase [Tomitella biformata]|uniref:phosphatidylinositol phosphate synthase n=1 Tax=Tomitella biformata TaxID=630403 RepID=UPI0004643119|nr:CDP-alcohol phosphatidyltransferase family protein [Tomitella biformata]
MLSVFARESVSKVTLPMGRALVKVGVTPDAITIFGTVATIAAALTLFPMGYLFPAALVIWFFVMFDMLDGATARARGGGTRYGAVLDATCDRVADGAIFVGIAWWILFTSESQSKSLLIATLICLVTSQVISYAKARAEASGLNGDGGWIERPDRLIIVLSAMGLSELFNIPWLMHVGMWALAVGSVITVLQRMWSVRTSPGARDLLPMDSAPPEAADE